MFKILSIFLLSFMSLFSINNDAVSIANFLDKKSFVISGEFYQYDFPQVPEHWDYVFKLYQLVYSEYNELH